MKMFSNCKPTKRSHVAAPPSNGSTTEDDEDAAIEKRRKRFFPSATPFIATKKPTLQQESQSKRTPITFELNKESSSTPQANPRHPIKIHFNTKNLDTPSFTSQISSIPRSIVLNKTPDVVVKRSFEANKHVPTSKSNLRIDYNSGGSDDDTKTQNAAKLVSGTKPTTGFRLNPTPTLPKQLPSSKATTSSMVPKSNVANPHLAIRQILLANKTSTKAKNTDVPPASTQSSKQQRLAITSDNQKESTFFRSQPKHQLSESKSASSDDDKLEFFPSKKSRSSERKSATPDKAEFFPSKKRQQSKTQDKAKSEFFPSKKSRSSGAKRASITFEEEDKKEPEFFPSKKRRISEDKRASITFDETPKSEPKRHSLLSNRSSRDDNKSRRESFFNSPATPHTYRSKFKNPPVYKGQDDRFYVAFFTNKYIFSNHFVCPSGVTVDDVEFPTTEHYYMYSKALFHNDANAAKRIQKTSDPKEAKRITAKFENFDTNGWKKVQYKIMEKACLAKFRQNSDLRRELFRTCNAVLVEASPSDQRWGVGLTMDNPDVADEDRWRGSNLLGKLLMNVRSKLATEFEDEFENEFEDGQQDLKRRAIKC